MTLNHIQDHFVWFSFNRSSIFKLWPQTAERMYEEKKAEWASNCKDGLLTSKDYFIRGHSQQRNTGGVEKYRTWFSVQENWASYSSQNYDGGVVAQ